MTDPMTPLTDESEALLAEVHGTQMALTVFPDRLRAIEAAAARRAIEGSGMERCATCGNERDTAIEVHADPGAAWPFHPYTPEAR